MDSEVLEMALVGASILMLAVYHLRLRHRIHSVPQQTSFGRNRIVRRHWLEYYAGARHEILVVQTLRNWLMSATFLASTSILLALGLLGIMTTSDKLSGLSQELNSLGSSDAYLLPIKFTLLLILFMTAFFAFAFSIRFLTHAGFAVNLPKTVETEASRLTQDGELERGALCYFVGLRCYYLSIPLALWLLGPLWMLAATGFLLLVLLKFD